MAANKGKELVKLAEQKSVAAERAWWGKRQKLEEAAELFVKAANQLKVAKEWNEAGDAFSSAATCYSKASPDNRFDVSNQYTSAAKCYRKTAPQDAVKCLTAAASMYIDDGRFSMAAKLYKDIGEIHQAEQENEKAIEALQQAADFFEGEGSTAQGNKCALEVAHLATLIPDYDRAINIYEKVATESLGSALGKYKAKDHFMKAAVCHLVRDVVGARKALEKYQDLQLEFSGTRQCKFLAELIEACSNYDVEAFQKAIFDYDSITRLDQWYTSQLLKIKQQLDKESGGGEDAEDDIC